MPVKLIFLLIVFVFSRNFVYADDDCEWVDLNTYVPFIWDCLEEDDWFADLIWGLSNILVTGIIVVALVALVVGGVMMTMWWAEQSLYSKWKELLIKVAVGIFLLWASWVILYMINPNFFGA